MYHLHTDCHVMRRKTVNVITNDEGEPVFTGARTWDAFNWLLETGNFSFMLHHENKQMRVMLGNVAG